MRNSSGWERALVELAPPRIDREYCWLWLQSASDQHCYARIGWLRNQRDKFKRDCNTCLYEANNFAHATDLEIRSFAKFIAR